MKSHALCKLKLRVIREIDDYASRAQIGDVIDVEFEAHHEIINIMRAHYYTDKLNEYFEIVM